MYVLSTRTPGGVISGVHVSRIVDVHRYGPCYYCPINVYVRRLATVAEISAYVSGISSNASFFFLLVPSDHGLCVVTDRTRCRRKPLSIRPSCAARTPASQHTARAQIRIRSRFPPQKRRSYHLLCTRAARSVL